MRAISEADESKPTNSNLDNVSRASPAKPANGDEGARAERTGTEQFSAANIPKSRWLKLARSYIEFGSRLCQFNPAGGERDGFGPSTRRSKLPLWALLVELFWLYFSIKLLACELLQHEFNVARHELSVFDEQQQRQQQLELHELAPLGTNNQAALAYSSGGGGGDGGEEEEEEEEEGENDHHDRDDQPHNNNHHHHHHRDALNKWSLERLLRRARLQRAETRVRQLGNAINELGFPCEVIFIFVLSMVYMGKVHKPLYVALRGPLQYGTIRALLDPERERALVTQRQIWQLVRAFSASSTNYTRAQCARLRAAYEKRAQSAERRSSNGAALALIECKRAMRKLRAEDVHAKRALHNLAASGQLLPPNRTPEWLDQAALVHLGIVLIFTALGIASILLIFVWGPYSGLFQFRMQMGPRDALMFVELICYILLGTSFNQFHLSIVVSTAVDQLKLVRELRRSVACLSRATHRQPGPHLDAHLLRILVHYKLLGCQMRATRASVGFTTGHMVFMMLLLPLMARIYLVHLSQNVRKLYMFWSAFFVLCCDTFIVPSCVLHARCLGLFKSLTCLQAHIDGAQAAHATAPRAPYSEHTVWLLRRELHLPEPAVGRFATRALMLDLTYASWAGVHFYCGLFLAPLTLRNTARSASALTDGNALMEALSLF